MDLRAIVTMCISQDSSSRHGFEGERGNFARISLLFVTLVSLPVSQCCHPDIVREVFGLLVALGFDVAVFTPAPYQRARLARP